MERRRWRAGERTPRRWPLRVWLLLALVGLALVDWHVTRPSALASVTTSSTSTSAPPSTSVTTTTSATASTTTLPTTSSSTTTVAGSGVAPHVEPPVVDASTVAIHPSCHLTLVASSTTTTSSSTSTAHLASAAPAPGHCVVLEIGDSLGNDLGWGLAREVTAGSGFTLVQKDLSSSGLVTDWFYDWPQHLSAMLARYHPDLTIVMIGGNDQQGIRSAHGALAFASAPWRDAYRQRVGAIVDRVRAAHSYLLWVGLPIMRPDGYRQGTNLLNSLYQSVAGHSPGAAFLPTWGLFADDQGRFAEAAPVGGTNQVLRSPDGIHFSYVGENVLATYVTTQIGSLFHVRVRPATPMAIRR